jgi:DNA-binding SARP family transcriptional activator/tetratricopeptide (TPR) repeat protein
MARPRTPVPAAGPCLLRLLRAPALSAGVHELRLSPKDAALLSFVAFEGPVRAERAAALLWPAAGDHQAGISLRQRLFRLRRDAHHPLVDFASVLSLHPQVRTDLSQALDALASDEHAADGALLGDLAFDDLPDFAEWLRVQRRQWRERRAAALAAVAERCEKEGALARGLAYALRQIDDDPLAEHAQRRLMRLHYLRGDHAAAIAAFERFEQRLKDELGTRPSAETIDLLATIERATAARTAAPRAVVPAALLRPPRLVGRERELQHLDAAWANGRVALVLGEAGIGKTRLLHDFAAERSGVVAAQARPGDAGIAYVLLARTLRALLAVQQPVLDAAARRELALVLPELGDAVAIAGDAQRLLLQRRTESLLAETLAQGLQALVLDDLHFADEPSLGVLQSLQQADALAGLRWLLAHRPADAGSTLAAWRAALEDSARIEVVTLAPLTEGQLAELVASLGLPGLDAQRLAPALARHTGGNPMFALETLKDLVLQGASGGGRLPQPASVQVLVQRRLAQLSPAALRLARAAALAGSAFDAALAAAVLDTHPLDLAEPWHELEAAQVIRDGAFAHDLVFDATRESVPQPIARLLHGRIARALVARGADGAVVAPHWAGAGEWQHAAEAYGVAARRARSASQRALEIEAWQSAADAYERAGRAEPAFDARCEAVPALIVVQGVEQAQRAVDRLMADAHTVGERVAALNARANAALMAADHAAGIAAANEAAALAVALESPWPAFEAARLGAVGLAIAGRHAEALATIEPWRERVERDGDAEQRGRFWADYAYVLNGVRRLRDTAAALGQAASHAQALGDLAELATLTSNLATVHMSLGRVHEALALAERAYALQAELGVADGPQGAVVQTYLGACLAMVGRYGEGLEHIDAALARLRRDRQVTWIAAASNFKALCLLHLGQFARARQALDVEPAPVDALRARGVHLAARIERALGHSGAASMERALVALNPGSDPHIRLHIQLDAAPSDDVAGTVVHCDAVLHEAERFEFGGVVAKARLRRAQAQAACGQVGEAAAALRALVAQWDSVPPADITLAESWWAAAQVFDAAGDGDDALMALGRGAQWLRRVALPNVPEAFRDSFLQRHPAHRALLAAADRRLDATAR